MNPNKKGKLKTTRDKILTGPILSTLLVLAYPLLLNQLIEIVYNMTDMFWLGKLGRVEVATPSVSWPIIGLLLSIGDGFVVAGFALVTQYIGTGDYEKANRSAGAMYSFMFITSTITGIFGVVTAPYFLHFMNVSETVYPYALSYLRVVFIEIPFSFTLFAFNSLAMATGDTKTPVKINTATIILNFLLDPILIFGWAGFPRLGVVGAAVATMLANTAGAFVGGYLLFTGKIGIHITRKLLKPDWDLYSRIFRVGLPSSASAVTMDFGGVLLARIIYTMGAQYGNPDVVFATYSITDKLVEVMFAVPISISAAMGTMIGQNIGAGLYDRAKRIAETAMLLNFVLLGVGAAALALFHAEVFGFFINDPEVIAESRKAALYLMTFLPFFGVYSAVTDVFQSSGHTRNELILSTLRLWGLRLPLGYGLGVLMHDTSGLWLGMGLSNLFSAVIAFAWFMKGAWTRKIIDN
ncbi:MATE family efflux transporter [Thermococcus sp. 18S1]|uniref:MATE family efflux transporter n=1 Tax=Thermococcus sp. 18S1 TaxID=1638210 RepID=UPI00143A873A|nr:MATE family efflux transporter [Thermococcus sp. 18S1]NJE30355.1 MATE family efflux transporter [Thermococcus sp. 18S1]